ncbi:MAG: Hpt domain-containing protein [Nitrospinae bacterium]|nr:Hpt domain-containing protein [Nitrospinota bacterium]
MAQEIDQESFDEFASEGKERIATMESALLNMENSSNQAEDIKSIFRDIHTIKGNSHFLGVDNIKSLSHVFEDMFGALRSGKIELTRELIDVSLEAVDFLTQMMNDKSCSIEAPETLIEKIQRIENGEAIDDILTKESTPPPEPEPEPEPIERGALRVFSIHPFNIIYIKLYEGITEDMGEKLSGIVFDYAQDEKTFILDASGIEGFSDTTVSIIERAFQEIDIFSSHVSIINVSMGFKEKVGNYDDSVICRSIGEAVVQLCKKAA